MKNLCKSKMIPEYHGAAKVLLIMKLSSIMLLTCLLQVSAINFGQKTRINLELENATFDDFVKSIEEQSDYRFVYLNETIKDKLITVKAKNSTVPDILSRSLPDAGINHEILDKLVIVKPDDVAIQAQSLISGIVVDESTEEPLPGLSIMVKGTTSGTITNPNGEFSIEVGSPSDVLIFSYVGYITREITVGDQDYINVKMQLDIMGLEEVVVVGYGTQKRVNLTGAVDVASSEKLENRPIVNAGIGLQGVLPNLNITIRNGDPSTTPDFNIRGYESINGGSPLILVDGVPIPLSAINPNDIASVAVLKDAGASAVYGARAAFGVILVETKKGQKGKMKITFGTEQSLTKPLFKIDAIDDPYKFVINRNIAYQAYRGRDQYDADYVAGTLAWSENPTFENAWGVVNGQIRFYGNNDYQEKLITDYAPQRSYNLSMSGASENATYYVSIGHLSKDGYFRNKEKNHKFKRTNLIAKLELKANNWLSLDTKVVLNSENNDQFYEYSGINQRLNTVTRATPMTPDYFPDLPYYLNPGDHDEYARYIGMNFNNNLLYAYLDHGGRSIYTENDFWLTQGITLTPIKGLKIRGDFSYNIYNRDREDVASKVEVVSTKLTDSNPVTYGKSANDFIRNRSDNNNYYVFNAYADYTLDKSANHYLKAMVGFNQEYGYNKFIGAEAANLLVPYINDMSATTGIQETSGSRAHVFLRGGFYRLNYIYKDRYLFEANGRYDGTSRFPQDSRFGFFPSFSAGWRISNENFMKGTRGWLDNLKIRASYGALGNQLLGSNYYPYISTMGTGSTNYLFSGGALSPYVSPAGLVSPTLTWESVITKNLGLDITLFRYRLNISADVYTRDTKDMLMRIEYPDVLGTNAPNENAADLRTKGWELSADWQDRIGQNWGYGLTLALSDNQSEITRYDNPTGALSENYVGQQLGEIWGYETQGFFQSEEDVAAAADQSALGSSWGAGDIQYTDLNGDGVINAGSNTLDDPGDRKIIGNRTARYSYGITGNLKYKNWSLTIFVQGVGKRDHVVNVTKHAGFYPYMANHAEEYFITETWSVDNRDAYFARPNLYAFKNYQAQSRYLQDAAYLRLKNLTLSYTLPQNIIGKIGLSRAQFYVAGMNLFEFTNMHHSIDPESLFTTRQEYYIQRIYTLGIKITI